MEIRFSYYIISMTIRNNGVSFPSAHTLYCASLFGVCRQDGNCAGEQPWSLQGEHPSLWVFGCLGFFCCCGLFGFLYFLFVFWLVGFCYFGELAVSSPSKIRADNAMLTILITLRNKWSANP